MSQGDKVQNSEICERLCKVLLDEDRLMILGLLALQPRSAAELLDQLPVRSPARAKLTRHLQQLRSAGLVSVQGAGENEQYRLDIDRLQELKRQLFSSSGGSELSGDEKVLAAFVKGNQLAQLPVQPSKLQVVLRWLVQVFEPDQTYPERTVNELLSGHAVDYATLRRLLIDYGYLIRQAGIYRRMEGA